MDDISHSIHVRNLVSALIKSSTSTGRQRSKVMPVQPFKDMFSSWPENCELDIKRLRLKCITLLALTIMVRPSDLAPKALLFNAESKDYSPVVLSVNDVEFKDNGFMSMLLHGTKNDTDRAGFQLLIPPASQSKLDPVSALQTYIERTNLNRPADGAIFLPLRPPYKAISHGTVANILSEAIRSAGLDSKMFRAKDFRPTGATVQVANGFDPNVVMKMGRWKTSSVFFEHYVHAQTPDAYTDSLLNSA
jgi:hypothetical protein